MRSPVSLAAIIAALAGPALAAPQVVVDLVPTGALVQAVMGDLGEVQVLLPQGASAHHYQMRPSDARALQSADLLVWIGPELAPWLSRATANLGAGADLRLLEAPGTHLQGYGGADAENHDHHADHGGHADHTDHADHDHDHDHDDRDHAAHDHDHDHSGTDPHAWLNPANAAPWLEAIAGSLAARDPDNAATYQANAQAAAQRIAALDDELRERLAPHAQERFIVFHDAYGYFTRHFGLQPAVAVTLGDAATPSAARIDQLRTQIAQSGASCAFPEFAHDDSLIQTVIEGSQTRLGGELSPEGGMLEPGAGQYEVLLTDMADTLIDCFTAAR